MVLDFIARQAGEDLCYSWEIFAAAAALCCCCRLGLARLKLVMLRYVLFSFFITAIEFNSYMRGTLRSLALRRFRHFSD
jgi:hypothetical protein